jgi:hypothetical protein
MGSSSCSDCNTELTAIKLIDQRERGPGVPHGELLYAMADQSPSDWTGKYPIEGTLHGKMCRECGRVYLFASSTS